MIRIKVKFDNEDFTYSYRFITNKELRDWKKSVEQHVIKERTNFVDIKKEFGSTCTNNEMKYLNVGGYIE